MAENRTNLEVFKFLTKNKSKLAVHLEAFIKNDTYIQDLSTAKAEDVVGFERQKSLTSFLEELVVLGKCAEEDLGNLQALQKRQQKVVGFSGDLLCEEMPYQKLPEVSEKAQGPKFQDEFQQKFCLARSHCQEMLNKMANLKQVLEKWQNTTAKKCGEIRELGQQLQRHELSQPPTEQIINSSLQRHQELERSQLKLVEECREAIEKNTWMPCLQKLGDGLCQMMSTWRTYQALMNVDLVTPVDEKEIFKEFHGMFSKWTTHIGEIRLANESLSSALTGSKLKNAMEILKRNIVDLNHKILSGAWSVEKQPPPCILEKDKLNVRVKFFGDLGKYIDTKTTRLAVFTQSDYKSRFEEKHLFKPSPSVGKDEIGATLIFPSIDIIKFKNTKRSDNNLNIEKYYRFVVDAKFRSPDISNIECLSMPFTMRSGSGQLWPGTGGVTWYCFTAKDKIFDPTFHHPRNLPVTEVVQLIHALVQARDPEKTFSQKEDAAVEQMVKSLHPDIAATNSVGIKQFVMDHMPYQGKPGSKREWSCFAWSIAARNTHKLLMDQVTTGVFNKLEDFVNHIQCIGKIRRAREGCAFLRLSCNQIDNPAGQDPYARIAVEVRYNGQEKPCLLEVKEVNKYSLPKCLEKFEGKGGEKLIKFVISEDLDIKSFKEQCKVLQPEKDNSCITDNGYIKVQEEPGAITVLEETVRLLTTEDTSEDNYPCASDLPAYKKVKLSNQSLPGDSSNSHKLPSSAFDDIPSTSTGIQEAASPMDITPTIILNREQQQEYEDEYKLLEPVPPTQGDLDSLLNQCGPQNTKL